MTEITDIRKFPLWPIRQPRAPRPVRFAIDPTAFVIAVIGAPLLVTALTFWLAFVPLIALALGGPVYLLCAIPFLLWDLPRREPSAGRITLIGFAAAMGFAGLLGLLALLQSGPVSWDMGSLAAIYAVMGAIFGPLWAAPIATLYRKSRRAHYARPIA